MKLNNNIRKYLTLGAALAGTTLMVSCDGEDGVDGATGATGATGADGNDGDSSGSASYGLDEFAPAKELLPLGSFTLTVEEDTSTAFVAGDQLVFDVDTESLFEYSFYNEDTDFLANTSDVFSQLGSWNTQAIVEGETTFVISDIDLDNDSSTSTNASNLNISSLTFTPNVAALGSQSGTFTLVANPEQVNINVAPNGDHEVTVLNSPVTDTIIGYRNITGNVIEINDPSSASATVLGSNYVIFSTDTTTYIGYLSTSVVDEVSVDLTSLSLSSSTITTSNIATLAEGEYAELTIENPQAINISGAYRFDLDASVGTDEDNLSDPQ